MIFLLDANMPRSALGFTGSDQGNLLIKKEYGAKYTRVSALEGHF